MADYRVLDIETVPDYTAWTPPAPRWVLAPRGDRTVRDSSTSLTVNNFDLLPAPAGVVLDDPFPPPQACRVVAISWFDLTSHDDGRYYHFESSTTRCVWSTKSPKEADAREKELITTFVEAQEADGAQLVTWNGRTFDLPVLNLRAMKHKIPMSWYYKERDVRYRFTDAGHCDLMDFLGDYGAGRMMKLHDVCRLIGLPGKTGEVNAASVADVVARGDDEAVMASVCAYCASDSFQTALLFVRSRFHKGMISAVEHDSAMQSFIASGEVRRYLPEVDHQSLMVSCA